VTIRLDAGRRARRCLPCFEADAGRLPGYANTVSLITRSPRLMKARRSARLAWSMRANSAAG